MERVEHRIWGEIRLRKEFSSSWRGTILCLLDSVFPSGFADEINTHFVQRRKTYQCSPFFHVIFQCSFSFYCPFAIDV
jgi:hypothetical protein